MFKFITHRHFLINLLAAIGLVIGLMFAFLWTLGYFTNHGDYEKIPMVEGKLLPEATQILEGKGFKVEVQDSLYIDTLKPLSVIRQSPDGNMLVKANRTIYLTLNRSQPPLVEIPNMVGFSFRNAEMYLKQLGLKLGDTTRRLDIAKDAVLEQVYQGKTITAGTKIFMGSTIGFVLGSGLGEDELDVPVITGMLFKDVKAQLRSLGLNIGAIVVDADVKDSANAIVYRQYPTQKTEAEDGQFQINKIRGGQGIDIWLGKKMKEEDPKKTDQ